MNQYSPISESNRSGGACRSESLREPIDHFPTKLVGFEEARGALEPKDLLNTSPVGAKPIIPDQSCTRCGAAPAVHALCPRSGPLAIAADLACDLPAHRQSLLGRWAGYPWPAGWSALSASGPGHTVHALVCSASQVRRRPVMYSVVTRGVSALISFSCRPTWRCHNTMPVATS
jgi:hypothetical protein